MNKRHHYKNLWHWIIPLQAHYFDNMFWQAASTWLRAYLLKIQRKYLDSNDWINVKHQVIVVIGKEFNCWSFNPFLLCFTSSYWFVQTSMALHAADYKGSASKWSWWGAAGCLCQTVTMTAINIIRPVSVSEVLKSGCQLDLTFHLWHSKDHLIRHGLHKTTSYKRLKAPGFEVTANTSIDYLLA